MQAANTDSVQTSFTQEVGIPEGLEEKIDGKSVINWIGAGGIREDDGIRFFETKRFAFPFLPRNKNHTQFST